MRKGVSLKRKLYLVFDSKGKKGHINFTVYATYKIWNIYESSNVSLFIYLLEVTKLGMSAYILFIFQKGHWTYVIPSSNT